jgi:hypothetical protein
MLRRVRERRMTRDEEETGMDLQLFRIGGA